MVPHAPLPFCAPQGYVFIKRVEDASFGKVQLNGCSDVSDLAAHASIAFKWGVPSTQVRLYRVSSTRAAAISSGSLVEDADLSADLLLPSLHSFTEAHVSSGLCILACTTQPAIRATGERAVVVLLLPRAPPHALPSL